jgi:hypothetical protein
MTVRKRISIAIFASWVLCVSSAFVIDALFPDVSFLVYFFVGAFIGLAAMFWATNGQRLY